MKEYKDPNEFSEHCWFLVEMNLIDFITMAINSEIISMLPDYYTSPNSRILHRHLQCHSL